MKLWSTSANIRGSGSHRRQESHADVLVWAGDTECAITILNQSKTYGYDSINRPSVYSVDPDCLRFGRTVINPEDAV